jgi:hypothetical protein
MDSNEQITGKEKEYNRMKGSRQWHERDKGCFNP